MMGSDARPEFARVHPGRGGSPHASHSAPLRVEDPPRARIKPGVCDTNSVT